ncbi:MAG: hypothetical protein ACFFDN_40750 [Candidatus Hodarchaeota archaeon]
MQRQYLDFNEKFLLTLYFSSKNSTLITRAMKLMFLYDEVFNIKEKVELDYIPYDFGPFADNFQLNLTPLITEELVSYRELCRADYISLDCIKEYFFNETNKKKLIKVLQQDYLNQEKYCQDIKLIKKLSQIYDRSRTKNLIQMCYYLKPEYSKNSIISDQINLLDRNFNQNVLIDLVTDIDKDHLLSLLKYRNGILDLFNIEENHRERESFCMILKNISSAMKTSDNLRKELLVHAIENIGVQDSNESYKMLKYKLLEFLSFDPEFIVNYDNRKQFLIFLLKSLQLNWPLKKNSIIEFRNLTKEYRKYVKIRNYRHYIDPLILGEGDLKIELAIKPKPQKHKKVADYSLDQVNIVDERKLKETILIESEISSFYEEYSIKDAQDLEESITEFDDIESTEETK